jgi:hypothetical protein
MTEYNALEYYEKLQSRAFKDQILVKAGQKFTISAHETVTLNKRDIRKLEMVAITQLKFGRYSEYTDNVMNVMGGGENSVKDKEILYFRLGWNNKKPAVVEKVKYGEYYKGEIPKSKNGLIAWEALIPTWKIVLACGSKMKKKKESSKKILVFKESFFKKILF